MGDFIQSKCLSRIHFTKGKELGLVIEDFLESIFSLQNYAPELHTQIILHDADYATDVEFPSTNRRIKHLLNGSPYSY